ncbi:MAG: DUF3108 domain-containing protein [Betaproteobacteria bacterium]
MSLKRFAICIALATVTAGHATPKLPAPASVVATHDVLRNGIHVGVVREQFESEDGRYRIVSESTAVGIFALIQPRPAVVTSTGRVTASGLQPERFDGTRGARDARRVSAEFDWRNQTLALAHDGKSERIELPPGTQDRLSIMYQFMFFEYGERRELEFAMTNGRKLDRYRYTVTHGVEIETPLGRMPTLHLVKQRQAGDSETEIWLAPQHRYFPVRMVIVEDDGVRYEQFITHLELQP